MSGALRELTFESAWIDTNGISAEEAAAVALEMYNLYLNSGNGGECDDMACCDEKIVESRINPTTGRPEVRYNGGDWEPDPNDPQFGVLVQPPIVGEGLPSQKCDAASNAMQHFTDIVSAMSSNIATAGSVYALAVAITGVLLEVFIIIVTGGVAAPLALTIVGMIWGAGSAAFTAGQVAFDEYWDTDALDKVLCALYCNIGENGQFTEDQYNAFLSEVRFELPSSPARDFVMTAITAGGAAGLSNMASYGGSADSDCSECDCDDCTGTAPTINNGELVSFDPETCRYTYSSVPFSGTNFISLSWAGDNCHNVILWDQTGGTVINWGSVLCGTSTYISNSIYPSGCLYYFDRTAATPFTLTLEFVPCS